MSARTLEQCDFQATRIGRLNPNLMVAALCMMTATAAGQTTTFTYQGRLADGGAPASGSYDLVFRVFDADVDGTQYGADISLPGVTVDAGLFTVALDFGPAVFDASPRWLEIEVNLEPLTPRQLVTAAPFALTSNVALYAQAPWIPNGSDLFYTDGNVGIGTNAPTAKLEIGGEPGTDGIRFPDGSLQTTAAVGGPGGSVWSLSGINAYFNAGKVGVGTSAPDAKFHVVGGPVWTANGWTKSIAINNATAIEFGYGAVGTRYGIGATSNLLTFFSTTTEGTGATANYFMVADAVGRVGIGTLAPASKLDIAATGDGVSILRLATERPWNFRQAYTGSGTALRLQPETGLKNFEITAVGGTNVATFVGDDANPRVGIGTISPAHTLHSVSTLSSANAVYGQATAGTAVAGVLGHSDASNGNGVIGEANTGTSAYGVWGRATQGIGGVFSGGNLALWAQGRARVTVLEITGGADFSENFDVVGADDGEGDEVEPGMVVCIDAKTPGRLVVCNKSYDRKVAGIVSGAGGVDVGMIMGQPGTLADGKHPVALTGRVYALCDASEEAIEPGDMLTTSETSGHAMKSNDREREHGAIVGKAMTSLAKGERGLVLVLVNLQ